MPARVVGFHIILTMYGFWLPNDERGSGSEKVWAEHLRPFGEASADRADGERSVAHRSFDRAKVRAAKRALKYPAVRLTGKQAKIAAQAIGALARRDGLLVHALSIMPDHLHCVLAAHARWTCERMMSRMKGAITRALVEAGMHPFQRLAQPDGLVPKLFARGGRHRFLFTPSDVRGRIRYVENNPVKSGLPRQRWSFVVPYLQVERRA